MATPIYWGGVRMALALASALIMIGLAGTLLWVNQRGRSENRRATRTLALFLMFWAGQVACRAFAVSAAGASDFSTQSAWSRSGFMLAMGVYLVGWFLLFIYPRPRTWIGTSRYGSWAWSVLTLLFWILYLVSPELFFRTVGGEDSALRTSAMGPLLIPFLVPIFPFLATVFAVEALRSPPGSKRTSLLLFSTGLVLASLSESVHDFGHYIVNWTGIGPYVVRPSGLQGFLRFAMQGLSIGGILAASSFVIHRLRTGPDPIDRRVAGAYAAMLVVLIAAGAVHAVHDFPSEDLYVVTATIREAITHMAGAIVMAYAFVRYGFLGLEIGLKRGIHKGTLVATFIAAFFVATVTAENFLADKYGWAIGGVVAGLLLFALAPMQRFADRLANAALPNVQEGHEYLEKRKRTIYRAAVEGALKDGFISHKERDVLAALADELQLTAKDMLTVERGAGVHGPPVEH